MIKACLESKLEINQKEILQLWTFAYVRLLNKPYENQVTLTGQNLPLKCCQPLEILAYFITGLDLLILEK